VTLESPLGTGWWVTVALLAPNVLWALFPGRVRRAAPEAAPRRLAWVAGVEWVSRLAAIVLPVFSRYQLRSTGEMAASCAMALSLSFYYTGWLRYFLGGREPVLLYQTLLGIPLPLAVSPVVFLLAASIALHSPALACATAVFGAAHLTLASAERERLLSASRLAER